MGRETGSGIISEAKPKILKVAPSSKGLVDKFHEVFKPHIQQKFLGLYYLRSIPVGNDVYLGAATVKNPSKDSDYLVSRRLVAHSFEVGDIESYESTKDIDKKIADKRKEIADYDVNAPYKDNDYKLMIAKRRLINQELTRLRKEEMKLVGTNEAAIRSSLLQAEKRVNVTTGSVSIEDYELFDTSNTTSLYSTFQEVVKVRLVGEKKLSSDEAKTWKFEGGRAITNEASDSSLRFRGDFEKARIKRDAKMKEISPILLRVNSFLGHSRGNPVEYVEE